MMKLLHSTSALWNTALSCHSIKMGLTTKEKSLMLKVPEQWRTLLTPLLSNKSVKRDQLTSVLAMRYRRQGTQSAESWDVLLTAMSRSVPFVDGDSTLGFQGLLWCFPQSFIQDFLKFILRFHDIISADSLDRFLSTPLPKSCFPSAHHLLQEVTAVLAKRNGLAHDSQTITEKDERNSLYSLKLSAGESTQGDFARSEIMNKHSRICPGDRTETETDARKSVEFMQTLQECNTSGGPGRIPSETLNPPLQGKEIDKTDTTTKASEKLASQLDSPTNTTLLTEDQNVKKPAIAKQSTTETVTSSDSFVIILDSSDEEDDSEVNMEALHEKGREKVYTRGELEVGKREREEICERGAEKVCKTTRQQQCERRIPDNISCEESQKENSEGVTKVEGSKHDETSCGDPDDDLSGDNVGDGSEILTSVQKLKEALSSGERVAASEDFDFLLSISAFQVSNAFAVVEWGNLEEDAVCGLIQGVLPLSERLSQAVGVALVDGIVRPLYNGIEETPSRQLMSCLGDLAAAFPRQLASVLCDCLKHTSCSSIQSEMITTLCKSWEADTLLFFFRKLCTSDLQLDENLLTVVQSIVGKQPDLSSDLLDPVLCLLETGALPLARNAKYGRLILNFVKGYKNQMISHLTSLQNIVGVHASVIRKSLQSALDSLSV